MADYQTSTRIIAISSLLVGLDYPVETWHTAYDLIKDHPAPNAIGDVAAIVKILTDARPGIVGALLAEDDESDLLTHDQIGLYVDPNLTAEPSQAAEETVEEAPKARTTRARSTS